MKFERYFTSDFIAVDKMIELDAEQSKHCKNVMRNKIGDTVIIFNGQGGEFLAEITNIEKKVVELRAKKHTNIENELVFDVSLFVAFPKAKRLEFLVEKAVELGVKEIIPLVTTRSEKFKNEINSNVIQRLNKKIIAACKQSRRNYIPEIKNAAIVNDLINKDFDRKFILHPTRQNFDFTIMSPKMKIAIAIGPEGGFVESEVHSFIENGWIPWFLGNRILRIETAAVASLSILNQISSNLAAI